MNRIAIEFISGLGMHPAEFIRVAADLGCHSVSLALAPLFETPLELPGWSLRENAELRREVIEALRDHEVSISNGEGFALVPGRDARQLIPDLDWMRELGAERVNAFSLDPDRTRAFDQVAEFVALAEERGFETTLEWGPIFGVADLPAALDVVRYVDRPSFSLLLDTLHFARAGLGPADLAGLPATTFGYVQVCDALLEFTPESYLYESQFERLPPGSGELPLAGILESLPRHLVLGLEIPMLAQAMAGVGIRERLSRCVEATRALLDSGSI
jgi:sugar phosphate isomerase/epimerase